LAMRVRSRTVPRRAGLLHVGISNHGPPPVAPQVVGVGHDGVSPELTDLRANQGVELLFAAGGGRVEGMGYGLEPPDDVERSVRIAVQDGDVAVGRSWLAARPAGSRQGVRRRARTAKRKQKKDRNKLTGQDSRGRDSHVSRRSAIVASSPAAHRR